MPWGTSDIDYEVGAGRVLGPNITVAAVPLKVKASHGDALPPELIKFEAHLVYRALKKRVGHHLAMGVVWRTENGSDDEELCFRPLLFAMDVGLAADLVSQGSHVVRRYRVLPYSDINEALVALLVDDSRQQHQLASVDGRPAVLEVFESVISLNSQLEYPVVSLIISANAHPDELARLGLLFAD
ncbi:hypothetical protein HGA91_01855 [candidate division WWE3 bacterium]|nr:hypothetical protein [candidate division WWE3 bacterium]